MMNNKIVVTTIKKIVITNSIKNDNLPSKFEVIDL